MLDIGWTELVVIAIVLIIVVGPKDLPPMLRAFGRMMTKMRGMASDFRQQFDEALKEADLDDVRQTLNDARKLNPANTLREAMNPLRQMGNDIKADLQKSTAAEQKPSATPVPPADAATPEVAADVALPKDQPKSDPVSSAALASAAKQLDRAAAAEAKPAVAPAVKAKKAARAKSPEKVDVALPAAEAKTTAKSPSRSRKKSDDTPTVAVAAKTAPKKSRKKGDA